MGTCPVGKRYKPLPLRRGFWREYLNKLNKGVVLLADEFSDREDVRNAAQVILIDLIESRLMARFVRPTLSSTGEFYSEFLVHYLEAIRQAEFCIWNELCDEVNNALAKQYDRNLSSKEAACLTYMFLEHKEPPDSTEYYTILTVFARAYEQLMQEKYQDDYSPERFYQALRQHMYNFIVPLIAMDPVISSLLTMNAKPRDLVTEPIMLHVHTKLDPRFMYLGENDSFSFKPKFVSAVYNHAEEHEIKEDGSGRTEDRGCPVLYAKKRDAIILFAIEELIVQHKLYTKRKLET